MNILAAILYFKMAAMKSNVLDIFITSVAIGRLYIYIYIYILCMILLSWGLCIMRGTGRIVLLSWGLYIMRGTGIEQWSGVA